MDTPTETPRKARQGIKVIIAGSRSIKDYSIVVIAAIKSGFQASEFVSGGASGVDLLGERWAEEMLTPVRRFPADWKRHHRAAGPIRNAEMAAYADALVAVWDGRSRGTANMIAQMRALGKPVSIYTVNDDGKAEVIPFELLDRAYVYPIIAKTRANMAKGGA